MICAIGICANTAGSIPATLPIVAGIGARNLLMEELCLQIVRWHWQSKRQAARTRCGIYETLSRSNGMAGTVLQNAVGNALAQEKRMRDAMEGLMHDHLGH